MKVIHLPRCLKEKYRELNKGLHSVFKYVENAYNKMPPKIIWIILDDKAVSCMYVMGNERYVTLNYYHKLLPTQQLAYGSSMAPSIFFSEGQFTKEVVIACSLMLVLCST